MRNLIFGTMVASFLFFSVCFVKAQEKLRPAGKGVSIEIVLVEAMGANGTIGDVKTPTRDEIIELEKQGKISRWTRVEIVTLDQQQATVQLLNGLRALENQLPESLAAEQAVLRRQVQSFK